MKRILQLCKELEKGIITPRMWRSSMVAQLSIMEDNHTKELAMRIANYEKE